MKFNFNHKPLGETSLTSRGFEIIEFNDHNGEQCNLQQSSVATESLLWLGVEKANPIIMAKDAIALGVKTDQTSGWVPYPMPAEVLMTTRMHLSRENVAGLIVVLTNWLFTDQLDVKPEMRSSEGVTDENAARVWHDELRRQIGELLRRLQESSDDLKEFKLPPGYKVELESEKVSIYHHGHADGLIFRGTQMFYRRPTMWLTDVNDEEKAVIKMVCLHIYNFEVNCL